MKPCGDGMTERLRATPWPAEGVPSRSTEECVPAVRLEDGVGKGNRGSQLEDGVGKGNRGSQRFTNGLLLGLLLISYRNSIQTGFKKSNLKRYSRYFSQKKSGVGLDQD